MDSPSERIRAAIKAHGLVQAQVARKCGLSPQNLQRILDGEITRSKHLPSIAAAVGVPMTWVTSGGNPPWGTATPTPEIALDSPREVPVLGTAGAADRGQRGVLYETAERALLSPHLALIEVRGGSAYPVIYDGQRAIINLKRKTNPNNLAVVVMAGSDEVLIKRWCPQPDGEHVVLASPDGGKHSLVVHMRDVRHCWPVVGVLYE